MAGRGPAPKPPSERARRNADPTPSVFVDAPADMLGPELPGGDWNPATVAWWLSWRRSPQATTFTETDWVFLLDTAFVHTAMWNGDTKAAAELRLRVSKFGATPEDRARLRMGIGKPAGNTEPAKPKPVAQVGRRERLLSVVEDVS